MQIDERLKTEIGNLVVQLHQKAALIDDLMAKIAELEKQVAELKEQKIGERS